MTDSGADIIDIGGMSTAPNAAPVTEEEEISRVVPVIKAIRQCGIQTPISVDTFRAKVAQAGLEAGADIINDVSAGVQDPTILDVARQFACPIILMHMRGDSTTMNSLSSYAQGDVVAGVRRELEDRVDMALRKGVRRWNIILDPGIGFAKDAKGNVALIRGLARLREANAGADAVSGMPTLPLSRASSPPPSVQNDKESSQLSSDAQSPHVTLRHFPMLVGPSRKRFIGTITGRSEAKDRMAGTAAACTASIMSGADIIRVHDVKEMVDVAKTADAIVRGDS
jgi:dihydroneopterin aldolase/2-amino-4-hydroxy-6-hydroxymethyldihydropteridine diphosphokinase/dihydropteroate synthase/2-amino-4-hydroxy-6-hydroxymethyldihydropteridine diphosphokinase/dihydropteroate synthase